MSVVRTSVRTMVADVVSQVGQALQVAVDAVAGVNPELLTVPVVLDLIAEVETVRRRLAALDRTLVAALCRTDPGELGVTRHADLLADRLLISRREARRRCAEAGELAPRHQLIGPALAPALAATAQAWQSGEVGAEHVALIRRFMAALPDHVDAATREQAEASLVDFSAQLSPEEVSKLAHQILVRLDQDGAEPDDRSAPPRGRGVSIAAQGADGLSRITGWLCPQARATLEPVLAVLAAPGKCNPDDTHPCIDGDPDDQQRQSDLRTAAQRNHDALIAMGRAVLARGQLGDCTGCPPPSS